jgi:hypothetical protein
MKNKTVVKVIFFQAKYNSQLALFFFPSKWLQIYMLFWFSSSQISTKFSEE